jgi:copper chaperone CopZ
MHELVVIKVEGMTCGHCEASVKRALSAVDGVVSVSADRQRSLVQLEVHRSTALDAAHLQDLVEDEGFLFGGIVPANTPT